MNIQRVWPSVIVAQDKLALGSYLESSTEPWLKKFFAVILSVLNLHLTTRIYEFLQCGTPSFYMANYFGIYQTL